MAHEKLVVTEVDKNKRFIRLSNGQKYLFSDEDGSIISSWHPGEAVWLGEGDFRANSCELSSDSDMKSPVTVIWVRS